jgi:hypothetical protein
VKQLTTESRWLRSMDLTKLGLLFLILGGLSFLILLFIALMSVGGSGSASGNSFTVWFGWFVSLVRLIYNIVVFWFVYLIIGAVLIVAGLIKKHKS